MDGGDGGGGGSNIRQTDRSRPSFARSLAWFFVDSPVTNQPSINQINHKSISRKILIARRTRENTIQSGGILITTLHYTALHCIHSFIHLFTRS